MKQRYIVVSALQDCGVEGCWFFSRSLGNNLEPEKRIATHVLGNYVGRGETRMVTKQPHGRITPASVLDQVQHLERLLTRLSEALERLAM